MNHAEPVTLAPESTPVSQGWQRLWFMLRVKSWTTLAVVPAQRGADAERAVNILAAAANRDGRVQVSTVSAVGCSAMDIRQLTDDMAAGPAGERHVALVACDPVHTNPAMIPVIQGASAVLLVVPLGDTALASVRTAVDLIGRDRILGTVSVG